MRHIRLLIEYDGSLYHGWQSQKSGGTIQDILTGALRRITSAEVRLTGASRTDAGVHALGQVAVFPTESVLSPATIRRALNATVPRDIRILSAVESDASFHPRYDAVSKSYLYLISAGQGPSAFMHKYLWDLRGDLHVERMTEAAGYLLGEHDFSSFRGAGCGAKTTVRTITSVEVEKLGEVSFMTSAIRGNFIRIRIEANAFLRHMVRNIVGTLASAGRGDIPPVQLKQILSARDRTKAGPTAPPQGLFLERVVYPDL